MSALLVFDPGYATGVAWFEDGQLASTQTICVDPGRGVRSVYGRMQHLLESRLGYSAVVVIEGYPPHPHPSTESLEVIKLVGFLEGATVNLGFPQVVVMPPFRRIPYIAEARCLPHHTRHEVDAIAHGLAFLYVAKHAVGQ